MMASRKGFISGAKMTGDPHQHRFLGDDAGEKCEVGEFRCVLPSETITHVLSQARRLRGSGRGLRCVNHALSWKLRLLC